MSQTLDDLLHIPLPAPALVIETWPDGDTYSFDDAEYDAETDRLRLTCGPPTAARAELSPEGHIVRIAAPDGYLCGLVLTNVHDRLERFGHIEVTLGPTQFVSLRVGDLAELLSRGRSRRVRRFAR
jgi:hypothetical protein